MAKFSLHIETDDNDEFFRLMSNLSSPTGVIVTGQPGQTFAVGLLAEQGPQPDEAGMAAQPIFGDSPAHVATVGDAAAAPLVAAASPQPVSVQPVVQQPAEPATPEKRKRRTKAEIQAEKDAAAAQAASPATGVDAVASPSDIPPTQPIFQQPAPVAQPVVEQPVVQQPAPVVQQPVAQSGASRSGLAQVADTDVNLEVLKAEMGQALSRVTAAQAQAALKGLGTASLSAAQPAQYVAIYHALRAL